MGTGLARQMVAAGHHVVIGSRDRVRAAEAAKRIGAKGHGTYGDAAADTEAMLLAVPWSAVDDALAMVHDHIAQKIVIDIVNPYVDGRLEVLADWSTAEHIQDHAPSAKVVKAWNHIYAPIVNSSPDFGGVAATVFVCGNDLAAKKSVLELASSMGYDPVDAGPLTSARYLEPLAGLMVTLAYEVGMGTDHALKLIGR